MPAFQLPAVWIDPARKTAAEMEGYTVVEPPAVLATHLSETIRANADELLSRQDVKDMCETVREFAPALVEDLIPDRVPVNVLPAEPCAYQKPYASLLSRIEKSWVTSVVLPLLNSPRKVVVDCLRRVNV